MKKIECAGNFLNNLTCLPLAEVVSLLNSAQQLATIYFFENEVEFIIILEEFYELNDVRVSLAMMEGFHFLEHPSTSVTWNFVDDLHSILQISVQ